MKRTIAIGAALALALTLAPSAHAEPAFPAAWKCSTSDGVGYSCKATFTVKAGKRTDQYLWAVKTCRNKVVAQAAALGAAPLPPTSVMSGARLVKGRTWRCGAFWSMVVPAS